MVLSIFAHAYCRGTGFYTVLGRSPGKGKQRLPKNKKGAADGAAFWVAHTFFHHCCLLAFTRLVHKGFEIGVNSSCNHCYRGDHQHFFLFIHADAPEMGNE